MLNGKYCGNCRYWINTTTTKKGKLPYYGTCAKGRPFRPRGAASFTVRSSGHNCRDWESKEENNNE